MLVRGRTLAGGHCVDVHWVRVYHLPTNLERTDVYFQASVFSSTDEAMARCSHASLHESMSTNRHGEAFVQRGATGAGVRPGRLERVQMKKEADGEKIVT